MNQTITDGGLQENSSPFLPHIQAMTKADIKENAAYYKTLFSYFSEGLATGEIILDEASNPTDFRLLETNKAFEEQTGFIKEMLGLPAHEWPPALRHAWIEDCEHAILNGQPLRFQHIDADTNRYYEGRVLIPAAGSFVLLLRDITDCAPTKQTLHETEELLRVTFGQAAIGMAHVDAKGNVLEANSKLAQILCFSREEICQKNIEDFTYPADGKIGKTEFQKLMEGKISSFTVEKRYLRRNGSILWGRLTLASIRSRNGGAAQYSIAFIEDLTCYKQAEEALHQERSQLQTILDNAPVNILMTNMQGTIVLANQAMFNVIDVPCREKFIGRNVGELFPAHIAKQLCANDQQALEADKAVHVEEMLPHQDGTLHTYLSVKFPVRYQNSRHPYGVCSISTDITEHKQADEERERLMEQLRSTAAIANRSHAQLEAVFQSIDDGIAVFDMDANLIMLNTALARINGFANIEEMRQRLDFYINTYELSQLDGTPIPVDQWPVSRVLRGESLKELEIFCRRRDTGQAWSISYSGAPVLDEQGTQILAVVTVHDITARKRLEQARQESERRLKLAVSIAHLGFWEWNVGTRECYLSPQWKKQLGYEEHELGNNPRTWYSRLHPEDRDRVLAAVNTYIANPGLDHRLEYRLQHRDGSYRWMIANAVPMNEHTGKGMKLTGTQLDVTENKLAEQRVLEAAQHDPLTGLPNRALIFEYAGHLLAAARRNHRRGALLFIDLDRFKPVNDLYGHEIGDRLLQEVAKRLTACVRNEDLVGRLGGDEFVIVLPHVADRYPAAPVAHHVIEALSSPFEINNLDISISASIGISHFPQHGTDVDTLIRAADLAMYQIKQGGRSNYQTYTPDLNRCANASSLIEASLKRALRRNGLILHYQPVIDMRSGRLIGAEALLRLINEDGHIVSPDRFVPIAESAGLIGQLGEWVAIEACRQHGEWCAQGLPPLTISINVSPLQFRQRGFTQRLQGIVQNSSIDPTCLQIEVTESTVMDSVEEAIQILNDIRKLGMGVALDDFGTGYSSLSHLSHLPLDKLKVDQSFVKRLDHDRASRAITGAIIALGRTLNLEVVGEGIESEDALAYLQEHGCNQAQGFLISQPLPPLEFAQWYKRKLALAPT